MNNRDRLGNLIEEAKELLEDRSGLYTDGWIAELMRMTKLAEAALEGESVPFVRSRAFYEPRKDDDILHAEKYYSRAPSFESEFYGLETIINDFKASRADLRIDELKQAAERFKNELELADLSGKIGSYDEKAAEKVRKELNDLNNTDDMAKSLVKVCNAMRRFKATRVFRQDIENDSNLFFCGDVRKTFLSDIKSDKILSDTFERVKKVSELYSFERTEMLLEFLTINTDYEKLNKHFNIWSTTDRVITFHTPKDAEYASIRFVLPEIENEDDGLGHVWIDDVRVCAGSGGDWEIDNSGFDEIRDGLPCSWKPVKIKGDPIMRVAEQYPFCGEGKASIYIENKHGSDCGAWEYEKLIPIESDTENTVIFLAKVDGKFKKGLKVEIIFYNSNKERIDEFSHYYNRKSVVREAAVAMVMQADAIIYYATGDRKYADKAKKEFMYVLCDFCQGMETWFAYDLRPDGCDAYGAVQGGRIMCSLMSVYTLIKDADVFSADEWDLVRKQLGYMASYLYDGRPRGEMAPEKIQSYAGNWQTDMACGMGLFCMAMPKTDESTILLDSINYFLKSQLTINLGEDGSWPESMRYHFATLMRFAIYAKILKNCTGEDWFTETPLLKMFEYPAIVQTPAYAYKNNKIGTPVFGDHVLSDGKEFAVFGLYYKEVYKLDSELGQLMYDTWIKAGRPENALKSESIMMENFFGGALDVQHKTIELSSTGKFRDAGVYVMRSNYGKPGKEGCCMISAPLKHIGHGHYDAGGFIIYKNNVPVVIDPGIEGYFDSTKDWYVSSSAHSVLQFARKDGKKLDPDPFDINLEKTEYSAIHGWNDVARTVEYTEFSAGEDADRFTVKIRNPEGEGLHTRNITYFKEEDKYIIDDTVEEYDGEFRWSLVTAMKSLEIGEDRVICHGWYGVDMEVVFETPVISITEENGRMTDWAEGSNAKIIRVVAKDRIKAVIKPIGKTK